LGKQTLHRRDQVEMKHILGQQPLPRHLFISLLPEVENFLSRFTITGVVESGERRGPRLKREDPFEVVQGIGAPTVGQTARIEFGDQDLSMLRCGS
jgi:hypothetical protein